MSISVSLASSHVRYAISDSLPHTHSSWIFLRSRHSHSSHSTKTNHNVNKSVHTYAQIADAQCANGTFLPKNHSFCLRFLRVCCAILSSGLFFICCGRLCPPGYHQNPVHLFSSLPNRIPWCTRRRDSPIHPPVSCRTIRASFISAKCGSFVEECVPYYNVINSACIPLSNFHIVARSH